jgi:hypothetical protein
MNLEPISNLVPLIIDSTKSVPTTVRIPGSRPTSPICQRLLCAFDQRFAHLRRRSSGQRHFEQSLCLVHLANDCMLFEDRCIQYCLDVRCHVLIQRAKPAWQSFPSAEHCLTIWRLLCRQVPFFSQNIDINPHLSENYGQHLVWTYHPQQYDTAQGYFTARNSISQHL